MAIGRWLLAIGLKRLTANSQRLSFNQISHLKQDHVIRGRVR